MDDEEMREKMEVLDGNQMWNTRAEAAGKDEKKNIR